MVSLRNLFSLFALVSAASNSNVCPEGPDRNLKVYVAYDATSCTLHPAWVLPYVGGGLSEVEKWVKGAGHEMSVSTARAGDPNRVDEKCFVEHFATASVAEAAENMSNYWSVNYDVNGAPIVQSVMYLLATHWLNGSIHKERRIVMVISSDPIRFGSEPFHLQPGKTLTEQCPMGRTTVAQFGETFRANGLGLAYYIWNPYPTHATKWEEAMIEFIVEAGITDYKSESHGGATDGSPAQQHTEDLIRALACPSWLATTTTYKPPVVNTQVKSCIMNAQERINAKVEKCLAI